MAPGGGGGGGDREERAYVHRPTHLSLENSTASI